MMKFAVLFHHPGDDVRQFEAGYTQFLAMVEQLPSIQRRQVVNVVGSPEGRSRYYRVLELYFADRETLFAALNSVAGQRAGAGLYEVFKPLGYTFEIIYADVYEESGGQTPA